MLSKMGQNNVTTTNGQHRQSPVGGAMEHNRPGS